MIKLRSQRKPKTHGWKKGDRFVCEECGKTAVLFGCSNMRPKYRTMLFYICGCKSTMQLATLHSHSFIGKKPPSAD